MEKILKALFVFWGIVIGLIVLKFVISIAPKDFTFISNFTTKLSTSLSAKQEDPNSINIPMQKQYGFTLDNTKSCIKHYESSIQEQGYHYSTNSHCLNGSCSLDIIFDNQIPKNVQLYTEKNNECKLTTYEVPQDLNIMGYYVSLDLTDDQKKNLHINPKDKIRLENASGYSISGNTRLYFYNNQIDKDNIVINDTIVGQIMFDKSANTTNTTPQSSNESSNETGMNIPHPEALYTYACNADLICKKTANTYVVNIDGVDFIPSKEFILSCLGGTKTNALCKFFTPIADTKTVQFNSKAEMDSYIKTSKNPALNDDIQEWEIKRLNRAKQKIRNSLL